MTWRGWRRVGLMVKRKRRTHLTLARAAFSMSFLQHLASIHCSSEQTWPWASATFYFSLKRWLCLCSWIIITWIWIMVLKWKLPSSGGASSNSVLSVSNCTSNEIAGIVFFFFLFSVILIIKKMLTVYSSYCLYLKFLYLRNSWI